jgi:prolipoprotein diacylglyceryltransferase
MTEPNQVVVVVQNLQHILDQLVTIAAIWFGICFVLVILLAVFHTDHTVHDDEV